MERRRSNETRGFWNQVWSGLGRLLALVLFIIGHFLVSRLLKAVFPPEMADVVAFAEVLVSLLFLLVYVYLTWEMMTCFFPSWKRRAIDDVDNQAREEEADDSR